MHVAFLLHYPAWRISILAFAAFLGGFVNSIAGGGGFIAFPTLLKSGLLPIQANATTTVALWPGQFTSIAGYREELRRHLRLVIPVVTVAAIGGAAGAWTLLHNSQNSFLRLVPYLFLLGSTAFAVSGPVSRAVKRRTQQHHDKEHILLIPLLISLLCICYYIGYFGAGAGLLTMTALAFCGVERIAEINSLKTVTTTTANLVACVTFIFHGAIVWHDAWYMMIACAIGGYTGARNSRRVSDKVLRPIIIVFGFSLAIYFFLHRSSF
ncbi:MAG TPA: sulfite exporter TauE/SafE family protein [Acidobacteriaceae bacterium]|nr:sulfite exporter TauE/SafE family protein [Acidobacteriaceae bacterium]